MGEQSESVVVVRIVEDGAWLARTEYEDCWCRCHEADAARM